MNKLTVADFFNIINPYIWPVLVSEQAKTHLRELTAQLPGNLTSMLVIECRLDANPTVDFACSIQVAERDVLVEKGLTAHMSQVLCSQPVYQRLSAFCNKWATPGTSLNKNIRSVWLEYDSDPTKGFVTVPGIFICSNNVRPVNHISDAQYSWLSKDAIPYLYGFDLPASTNDRLLECIKQLPAHASLLHIGYFPDRTPAFIRCCLKGLLPGDILPYLTKIGYLDDVQALALLLDDLWEPDQSININLDIIDGIGPRIGLEYLLKYRGTATINQRFNRLFKYIVENDLCLPEKLFALRAYPGYSDENTFSGCWPEPLVVATNLLGSQFVSVIQRDLSHIKLVYHPRHRIEAKLYLQAFHTWLPPLQATKTALVYAARASGAG